MNLQPLDIVIHIINILVLFVILRTLLYKPVHSYMQKRSDGVKAELDAAQAAKKEAADARTALEAEQSAAEGKANEAAAAVLAKADAQADEAIAGAKAQAEQIIADAHRRAEAEAARTLDASREEITALSVEIAQKMLSREISEKDNRAIAEAFFRKVGDSLEK